MGMDMLVTAVKRGTFNVECNFEELASNLIGFYNLITKILG